MIDKCLQKKRIFNALYGQLLVTLKFCKDHASMSRTWWVGLPAFPRALSPIQHVTPLTRCTIHHTARRYALPEHLHTRAISFFLVVCIHSELGDLFCIHTRQNVICFAYTRAEVRPRIPYIERSLHTDAGPRRIGVYLMNLFMQKLIHI